MKGVVTMARNKATPVTFNLPDNDVVQLITWEFVLEKLNKQLQPTLDLMAENNTHLDHIATKLESYIDDSGDDVPEEGGN